MRSNGVVLDDPTIDDGFGVLEGGKAMYANVPLINVDYEFRGNHRAAPDAPASDALTPLECKILDQLVHENGASGLPTQTIAFYLKKLARLGGYLARNSDPPPGNMVMWRGMSRLTDIQLGFLLGAKLVGN